MHALRSVSLAALAALAALGHGLQRSWVGARHLLLFDRLAHGVLQPRRGVEQPLVTPGAQQRQHRVETPLHRRRLGAGLAARVVEREAAQLGELALRLQPEKVVELGGFEWCRRGEFDRQL